MQGNSPVEVKMYMHDLGSDNGVSNKANELGLSNGNAVYTMAAMRHGEWVVAMDSLMKIFGRGTNQGTKKILDIVGGPKGFEEWAKELNLKYMKSDKANLTDIQKEGYEVMSKFWTMWGERLEKTGLIGNKVYFQEKMLLNDLEIKRATLKITELEKYFDIKIKFENEEEIYSVGGMLFFIANKVPKNNQIYKFENQLQFKVINATRQFW